MNNECNLPMIERKRLPFFPNDNIHKYQMGQDVPSFGVYFPIADQSGITCSIRWLPKSRAPRLFGRYQFVFLKCSIHSRPCGKGFRLNRRHHRCW